MPKLLVINKKILEKLYLRDKRGTYEIAKFFSCSQATIMSRLRKYHIRTRSIQEAKSLTAPKHKRRNFDGNLKEKSYLIGFRLGDLYVSKTHPNSPTIRVSTNTTKKEQLSLVTKLFSKYGYVKIYNEDRRGARSIRCFLNNSFSFLIQKEDCIESWILKNKSYFSSFLAGYIDAEGSFISKQNKLFSIQTQQKNILAQISKNLNKYKIRCIKPILSRSAGSVMSGIKSRKDVWMLYIYNKDNLIKLIRFVEKSIQHEKRKKDMLKLLNYLQYGRA